MGRYTLGLDADYRLEFIDDLFWVLDFYANYDSQPISKDASNSDYGVTSSIAYKF